MAKQANNGKSVEVILAFVFGVAFLLTLSLFISYANSTKDEFDRGWEAANRLGNAEEYFLGDDDSYTSTITYTDGSQIFLSPNQYRIQLKATDGTYADLGSVNYLLPSYRTTNEKIVGLASVGEYGNSELVFIDPSERKSVRLENNGWFEGPDVVEFVSDQLDVASSKSTYSITTNVPENECSAAYTSEELHTLDLVNYFQAVVDVCNELVGDVYLSQILVNGDVGYSFNPIKLERQPGGPEAPMGYEPNIRIQLRGVSPKLDKVYFEFPTRRSVDSDGKYREIEFPYGTFSIDSEGTVQQEAFPEDMVTIIYE